MVAMSSPPLSSTRLKSKRGVFTSRTRTRTRTCAMVWPFSSNNDKASASKNKDFRTLKQQRDDAFGATAEERIRRSQERRAETARMMKMSNAEKRKFREKAKPERAKGPYQDEKEGGGFLSQGFFIIPQAPFGNPEMDGGERFDLKGKYVDEGWVDESESSSSNFFSKLFGGGGGGKQSSKKK